MRVLVTGATGFVGEHLVALLASHGAGVYGTHLSEPAERRVQARLFPCDLRDADRLGAIFRDVRPDRIVHLAAQSSPSQSLEHFKEVYDANFWGTYHLLESVRQLSPRARVLIVGSGQCYGEARSKRTPIAETQPFAPPNPYALSKASADMLAGQYHSRFGLHIVRARPFNHTGPGQQRGFVCSDYAFQLAEIELGRQKAILNVRDPHAERDFSDVRDVVRAYELLLQKGKPGEAYNVASGRLISIERIVSLLVSFCSRSVRLKIQRDIRAGDIRVLYGSSLKLRRTTGWKPMYNMRQTMRDLFEYWKLHLGEMN